LDGVLLQTDANTDNNYREGKTQNSSVETSALVLQNAANSTNAFQVQNASGAAVFTVDTTDTNLITNPGAEVNAQGWSAKGGGKAVRDTSQQSFGVASFKMTTTTTGDGMQFTGLSLPIGTYSIGFSAKNSGTNWGASALLAGITNTGGDTNCTLAPTVGASAPATTAWTRFTCSVTVSTTVGTAFYIKSNEAVAHTTWIDGVELDFSSTLTPYGVGGISINGVIKTPLTLQNQSDSTVALSLYNAAGASILTADTRNKTVIIGSSTSDGTGVMLQLDTGDSSFSEAGVSCTATANQGAMYFNGGTATGNTLRFCNGSEGWQDLISTATMGSIMYGVVPDSGPTLGDLVGINATIANAGPCKVYVGSGANTVRWTGCTVYANGRKQIISAQGVDQNVTTTANAFQNVCISLANSGFTLLGANVTETSAGVPAFSVSAPPICIATLKENGTGNGLAAIYDTRVFTNTTKTYATIGTAGAARGWVVRPTAIAGTWQTVPAIAGNGKIGGVVVATDQAAGTTNINAIIATAGPVYIKSNTTGGTNAINDYIESSGTTAGYVMTVLSAPAAAYSTLGIAQSSCVDDLWNTGRYLPGLDLYQS
jgi:hypothetical protein